MKLRLYRAVVRCCAFSGYAPHFPFSGSIVSRGRLCYRCKYIRQFDSNLVMPDDAIFGSEEYKPLKKKIWESGEHQ